VVPLTNILEISYRAETPAQAKAMADALRDAYVDSVLETRRREANRDADWYAQQADKAKALLTQADDAKTAYEKANGIVMQADNSDVDSARLRALAGQGAMGAVAPPPVAQASATDMQLAAIDAQIAQASQSLGPNHPQMIELKSRRNLIANLAAQEHQRMQSAASQMAAAAAVNASAVDRAVAQQTSRVIAKREKIERLQQLQAEVNIRRDQYYKAMARSAELRQEASVADTGLTPMGIALLPQKPSFPNKPLIMGGALGLGLAMGLALSVLVELFGRRVRSADDLLGSFDVPMLAVVRTRPRTPFALPRLPTPGQRRLPNRKVANA